MENRRGSRCTRSWGGKLDKACVKQIMLNMKSVNTRDLAHRSKEVRKTLAGGERIAWVSRGKLIATLEPAGKGGNRTKVDWLSRAREAGAVNNHTESVSDLVYADRD